MRTRHILPRLVCFAILSGCSGEKLPDLGADGDLPPEMGDSGHDQTVGGTSSKDMSGPGTAVLSWNAAAMSASSLAGYRVYYGSSSGAYTSNIAVGKVLTYTVTGLPLGSTYFAVTAFDGFGNESVFSNEVTKTIQ